MKSNRFVIVAFITCIFVLFITSCAPLASIKNDVKSKSSSNSKVFFNAKKGDKFKFTYDSLIKEGTLKLELINSNGKVIQTFETNKKDLEQISLDKAGEYVLSANI
uniref:hypothetical protein n=1 Tax=Clostridium arbusti TaxID=1137848 RepID=UPI000287E7F0